MNDSKVIDGLIFDKKENGYVLNVLKSKQSFENDHDFYVCLNNVKNNPDVRILIMHGEEYCLEKENENIIQWSPVKCFQA